MCDAWESDPTWDPRADLEYVISEEFAERCRHNWDLEMKSWDRLIREVIWRAENDTNRVKYHHRLQMHEVYYMHSNGFGVRVPEGTETNDGYVKIRHGTQYTIVLHNNYRGFCSGIPADADVEIDGKHIGTFRVRSGEVVALERSTIDSGRFTAFKANSQEGRQVGLNPNHEETGLIKVTFHPGREKVKKHSVVPAVHNQPWPHDQPVYRGYGGEVERCCSMGISADSLAAAGTGLTGRSDQLFTDVEDLDYSGYGSVTIYLRLVVFNDESPRVLRSASRPTTTPYPKPINY